MSYNLRKRKTLTDSESTSSSSAIQPVISEKFYKYIKNQGFNYDVWRSIFDYLNPFLIHLMFKQPPAKSSSSTNAIPLLPIELLISWNNSGILDKFEHVLLSYNFRKTLASKVARFGNYQTMMWFQSNGLTLNKSVLVSAAQRGEIELFDSIWKDIHHDNVLKEEDLTKSASLCLDVIKGAAQFGRLDFLKYAERTYKLNLDDPDDVLTVLHAASKHGHLNILKWYYFEMNRSTAFQRVKNLYCVYYDDKKVFSAAVEGNKLNVLVWLKSFLAIETWDLFVGVSVHPCVSIAARHGNKEMVMWLIGEGFKSDIHSASAAAYAGSIDLLKLLSTFKAPFSDDVYTNAAEKGHLALLQWAKANAENNYPWPVSKMFPAAAKCDNVELYQWLFDQQFPFEEETSFSNALEKGHFKLIKFARSNGSNFWNDEFYYSLLEGAATLGDLETMEWAIAEYMETNSYAVAERMGRSYIVTPIDIANHASRHIKFFVPVIEAAASGGHIHILEYLRPTNNMEVFYAKVTAAAARHGHVAILEWASANTDFSWAYTCFLAAIEGSQFKVLVWLKTHFPDALMKHSHPMLLAALGGDIEIFKWLRNNGMKWHPSTYTVAKQSYHYDIAEWAVKNGCPKDEYTSGRISVTKAKRLELSVYVKVGELSQEVIIQL